MSNEIHSVLSIQRSQQSFTPWLWWVLANALGQAAGVVIVLIADRVISEDVSSQFRETLVGYMVTAGLVGFIDGALVGLAQALVFRRYTHKSLLLQLALVTGLAGVVPWLFGTSAGAIGAYLLGACSYMLVGGLTGSIIGFAQWLVLRRHMRLSALWVAANGLAGVVGVLAYVLFSAWWATLTGVDSPWGKLGSGLGSPLPEAIVGMAVYGAVTGVAFVRLIRTQAARHLTISPVTLDSLPD